MCFSIVHITRRTWKALLTSHRSGLEIRLIGKCPTSADHQGTLPLTPVDRDGKRLLKWKKKVSNYTCNSKSEYVMASLPHCPTFTKKTIAVFTGVLIPCLEGKKYQMTKNWIRDARSYFLAKATTLPLMKSTSDCLKHRIFTLWRNVLQQDRATK